MKCFVISLTLLATALAAQAAEPEKTKPPIAGPVDGIASFYSTRYNGRVTASGERFNSEALTAASLRIPLGSRVKITNLANNRSVVVRVNDRGPFVKGRDISVTRRAARQLGFVKAGTAKVRITRLSQASR